MGKRKNREGRVGGRGWTFVQSKEREKMDGIGIIGTYSTTLPDPMTTTRS